MLDYLFEHAYIVTMNGPGDELHDGYVGVKDGKIVSVTPYQPQEEAGQTIDCTGMILMPGMVNTHGHTGMTLLRGYADDHELYDWLHNHIYPAEAQMTADDIRAGTLLGYMESLAAGITCTSDMYLISPEIFDAAVEAGVKANVSRALSFDRGEDQEFTKTPVYLETVENLKKVGDNKGLVRIEVAIHNALTSTPKAWKEIADFAKEHELRMHVHLSETTDERGECLSIYGKTAVELFDEAGVFDVPTCAAHGVWLTNEDMDILKERQVSIAYNPISNLKLAGGVAPVKKMLEHGINVTIGTDGAASNNTLDMFEEMKVAAILQKGMNYNPTIMNAYETLHMATVGGAFAMGRGHECGRIAEGLDADIVLVDMTTPHMQPMYSPVSHLVYCAHSQDVKLTMIKGRILYRNGEFYTIDKEKVYAEAQAFADRLMSLRRNALI